VKEVKVDLIKIESVETETDLKTWYDQQIQNITNLFQDDRLFVAHDAVQAMIKSLQSETIPTDLKKFVTKYEQDFNESSLNKDILQKVKESNALLTELGSNNGWTMVRNLGGVQTLIRKEEGKDIFSFKVVGEVDSSALNITALIYEIDLFPNWFPCCRASKDLCSVSRFHKQCTVTIDIPFSLGRFLILDGYGVDVSERNQLIINIKSIRESKHCTLPETPADACLIQMYLGGFLIEPLTRDKSRVSFIVNVDPQMDYISPYLLNWFAGKLIHLLLSRMRSYANFGSDSEYAKRIKSNPAVYAYVQQRLEQLFQKS